MTLHRVAWRDKDTGRNTHTDHDTPELAEQHLATLQLAGVKEACTYPIDIWEN